MALGARRRVRRWEEEAARVRATEGASQGFFFQAEDGIRDGRVTGVQTCALPISGMSARVQLDGLQQVGGTLRRQAAAQEGKVLAPIAGLPAEVRQMRREVHRVLTGARSEERREGKSVEVGGGRLCTSKGCDGSAW